MAKSKNNACAYCFGNGIDRYWHDVGITGPDGKPFPVRWCLKVPSKDAYACPQCGLPKDLLAPPVAGKNK